MCPGRTVSFAHDAASARVRPLAPSPRATTPTRRGHTHAPVIVRRAPWGKVAAGVAAAALLVVLFTRATLEAVAYHPIFTQRIQEQRAPLDSGDNHGKRTDN